MRNEWENAGGGLGKVPGIQEAYGPCRLQLPSVKPKLALDNVSPSPTLTPSFKVSAQP